MNNAAEKVTIMFRAQVQERCQLQYAKSDNIHKWTSQWINSANLQPQNLDTFRMAKSVSVQVSQNLLAVCPPKHSSIPWRLPHQQRLDSRLYRLKFS
jgi:hypothetical protein